MKTAAKKKVTFKKYDAAEYIKDKETAIAFLEVALEENDPDFLLRAIDNIARSKGMTQIAKEMKLSRRGLYKSFAPDGNPSFRTMFKLIDLLGLQIKLVQKPAAETPQTEAIAQ